MQPVTGFALKVTTVHEVITLDMADDGFDGLATSEVASLLLVDPFGLTPVHDVHAGQIRIHWLLLAACRSKNLRRAWARQPASVTPRPKLTLYPA